jgi:AcrR family transcriptional regulator
VSTEPIPGPLRAVPERIAAGDADVASDPAEGLRERKKRLMRQLISDTATMMFLDRGFEEVRVAEIAAACDVSEKTVYNYFPTKESLALDREEGMAAGIRRALGPSGAAMSPVDAVIGLITAEGHRLSESGAEEHAQPLDLAIVHRFMDMLEGTPSLRAAQRDMMDRLTEVAAQAMAARAGINPDDPEPQIAAHALVGLWRVQYHAMRKYSDSSRSPDEVRDRILAEVRRAARLIDTGLWSFGMAVQGSNGREQLKAAAEAANDARRQVLAAIKQARDAWRQVVTEAHRHEDHHVHPARPGRPPRKRNDQAT